MCFSPEADVVSGVVVIGIGAFALRHTRDRSEVPLAALPVLLGAHQLVESLVWWSLEGDVSHQVGRIATWVYLAIAFSLPVVFPVVLTLLEPPGKRRVQRWFVALGCVVTLVLADALFRGPVTASIDGHHVAYSVDLAHGGLVVAAYVVATCGPALLSSHRHIQLYGVANLVVVALLGWLASDALVSLWCLWAALTSFAAVAHIRWAERPPTRPRLVLRS